MNNGSERTPERLRITNWVENVPVRGLAGEIIGRAKVSDRGEIQASIDIGACAEETYIQLLMDRMYDGLSIAPYAVPAEPKQPTMKYSDEVRTRLAENNPLKKKEN